MARTQTRADPKLLEDLGRREALVVLVRHGESQGNVEGLFSSDKNTLPLTPLGEQQARVTARELKKLKVTRVVSSEVLRARQTAGIISAELDLEVVTDSRLNERHMGRLEETVSQGPTWRFIRDSGVESFPELVARSSSFLHDADSGVVIGVSHGDVVRAPALWALGLDEISGFGIRSYNANMSIYHIQPNHEVALIAVGLPLLDELVLARIPKQFIAQI